jgi:hypothetical protein
VSHRTREPKQVSCYCYRYIYPFPGFHSRIQAGDDESSMNFWPLKPNSPPRSERTQLRRILLPRTSVNKGHSKHLYLEPATTTAPQEGAKERRFPPAPLRRSTGLSEERRCARALFASQANAPLSYSCRNEHTSLSRCSISLKASLIIWGESGLLEPKTVARALSSPGHHAAPRVGESRSCRRLR